MFFRVLNIKASSGDRSVNLTRAEQETKELRDPGQLLVKLCQSLALEVR